MSDPNILSADPKIYTAVIFRADGSIRSLCAGNRAFMDLNVELLEPDGCWREVAPTVADPDYPGGCRPIRMTDVPPLAELPAPAPWPLAEPGSDPS